MGHVESVNVAVVQTGPWTGRIGSTGIDKRPVAEPVEFTESGVAGDVVCDTKHHGAWYQAAYSFDVEELRHWSEELGKELVPGNAGENLSTVGCDTSDAVVGERWRIGSVVLRVTGPRQPCRVFQAFWDVEQWIKRFTAHGRPGAYFAVEEPGRISAGDTVEVLSRPEHGVTVADVFALTLQRRKELSAHVAQVLPDLPEKWRAEVARAL